MGGCSAGAGGGGGVQLVVVKVVERRGMRVAAGPAGASPRGR